MLVALLSLSLVSAAPQEPVLDSFSPIRFGDDAANTWAEPFVPGATYDPAVANPRDVLGQPVGSRIASHDEILRILMAIAATSDRVTVEEYGRTYEGRPLVTATITSPRNQARMAEIRETAQLLWDPRDAGGDLDDAIREQPGIAWMGYGIHGDETSATEASVPVAYHLAACTDEDVVALLEDVVVVLDPCLNPDGRERIRSMVVQSAGYRANLDDGAMQRGRWPGGRGNHYLFDMNRDWMAGEAPETRGRWARLLELPPQIFVDAHEMSGLDTFLFYPQTAPRNPNLPEELFKWQGVMANDAARVFDRYGWGYYTREWADALYPGYSDAWGSLTGAIGLLYEQGRTIGAPLERESGEIVPYRESVHGQVAVSLSNLGTFRSNKDAILRDYLAHRRRASSAEAPMADRAFLVAPTADVERDARFVRTMRGQGIEIVRAREAFVARDVTTILGESLDERSFPAGTWIVPARQPQGALVRAYLELDPRLDADFLQEERESIERDRGSKVYDVTAWNLAQQMGVDGAWARVPEVDAAPAPPVARPSEPAAELGGVYAWVAHGGDTRSLRFAARAMELGLQVHVSDRDFDARVRAAGGGVVERSFPRGSFLLRRHENPEGVDELVVRASRDARALVHGVESGRGVGDGPDLGGGHFLLLERPRVAVLSNSPVSRDQFGHVWSLLDNDLQVPVTLVDAQAYRAVDLDEYNVLVLPPGAGSFVVERAESLKGWVRGGGVLVAVGSSAFALADDELGLSGNRRRREVLEELDEYAWRTRKERGSYEVQIDADALYGAVVEPSEESTERAEADEASTADAAEAESEEGTRNDAEGEGGGDAEAVDAWQRRFSPAGVILRGEVDPESWITSGIDRTEVPVLFGGSSVLMPASRPAVRLAPSETLRLGGLLWPEARARIADSAWLTVESLGDGLVVSFAANPVFRGSWRGTARFLGNAVVLGPGMTR
ncbi:MAG: M14 family zinc carboxypeptidase [Planctomycetota bacterium]